MDAPMTDDGPAAVATAFVVHDGDVLLLKRGSAAPEYPGRWSGVSGRIPGDEEPRETATREVAEETGLDVEILDEGDVLEVVDGDRRFHVHPFRCQAPSRNVKLDWENDACAWVPPYEIRARETVPGLWEAWERLAP